MGVVSAYIYAHIYKGVPHVWISEVVSEYTLLLSLPYCVRRGLSHPKAHLLLQLDGQANDPQGSSISSPTELGFPELPANRGPCV